MLASADGEAVGSRGHVGGCGLLGCGVSVARGRVSRPRLAHEAGPPRRGRPRVLRAPGRGRRGRGRGASPGSTSRSPTSPTRSSRPSLRTSSTSIAPARTPNPCVRCNERIKFGAFLERADALGFDFVATGHYVRRARHADGTWRLHRGLDAAKDQSYVLHMLGQPQLARSLFPIGGLTKPQTRAHAERFGLPVAGKPDSQEVCFVPGADHGAFLARARPGPGSQRVDHRPGGQRPGRARRDVPVHARPAAGTAGLHRRAQLRRRDRPGRQPRRRRPAGAPLAAWPDGGAGQLGRPPAGGSVRGRGPYPLQGRRRPGRDRAGRRRRAGRVPNAPARRHARASRWRSTRGTSCLGGGTIASAAGQAPRAPAHEAQAAELRRSRPGHGPAHHRAHRTTTRRPAPRRWASGSSSRPTASATPTFRTSKRPLPAVPDDAPEVCPPHGRDRPPASGSARCSRSPAP